MTETTDRDAWNAEYDRKIQAQTEALASLGFGPAFNTGGMGGLFAPDFATCQTCGAAVVLAPQGEDQPAVKHHAWHEAASA